MKLTIIPSDKTIGIDNNFLLKIKENLSWIPSNIHAVQWDETWGEIEYNDGTPNKKIEELGIYEQAIKDYQNEIQRRKDEKIAEENARDYWEELRVERNSKLQECDWTQIPDAPLSDTQKTEWQNYRLLLRNLPENIQDPKSLVLDSLHSDWPTQPQK